MSAMLALHVVRDKERWPVCASPLPSDRISGFRFNGSGDAKRPSQRFILQNAGGTLPEGNGALLYVMGTIGNPPCPKAAMPLSRQHEQFDSIDAARLRLPRD